jgi:hypothetical protein
MGRSRQDSVAVLSGLYVFKANDYDFDDAWLDPDADLSEIAKAAKNVIESILGTGDSTDYFLQLYGRKLATDSADK